MKVEKFSYSSISCFTDCRPKYYWKYVLNLEPKAESKALLIGRAVHMGLESFYNGDLKGLSEKVGSLPLLEEKLSACKAWTIPWYVAEPLANVFLPLMEKDDIAYNRPFHMALGILAGYTLIYDPKEFGSVRTEVELECSLPDFTFVGHLDGIIEKEGKKFLIEHKTTSKTNIPSYIGELQMGFQDLGYILLCQMNGISLAGVEYNIIRKPYLKQGKKETDDGFCNRLTQVYIDDAKKVKEGAPSKYYFRETLFRSKREVEAYGSELGQIVSEIQSNPTFYRTSRCSPYCEYKMLCQGEREGVDLDFLKKENYNGGSKSLSD